MGRPSSYSEKIADLICLRLAQGDSLRKICRDADMPGESTVYAWLFNDKVFQEKYARAREAQAEPHLEDMLAIADDPDLKADDKRVRIDARKWAMSKLAAKKYGDKQQVEVGNKDGETLKVESTPVNAALALHVAEALRIAGTKAPEQ